MYKKNNAENGNFKAMRAGSWDKPFFVGASVNYLTWPVICVIPQPENDFFSVCKNKLDFKKKNVFSCLM